MTAAAARRMGGARGRARRRWLLLGAVGTAAACARGPTVSPGPGAPASARLAELVAEFSARPPSETAVPDVSYREVRRRAGAARARLARLDAIPEAELPHEEVLTRELLRWEAWKALQDTVLYWYGFDILPANSPLRGVTAGLAARSLATPADRAAYLATLDGTAVLLRGLGDKLRAQAARDIVMSAEQIGPVVAYLRSLDRPASDSPFAPAVRRLAGVPAADRAAFETAVARAIEAGVRPALRELAGLVDRDLRARAPAGVGLWQYPGGIDAYRLLVRRETTLDITPEAIHELALRAMDALEARMQAVRDSLGFRGTKAEFHEQLRRDRRFYVSTPDSVGRRLMSYAERIEPVLARAFSSRPRAPYGVRRLDPLLEPSMTYGYYNWPLGDDPHGYYNFNGSDLDQRSLLLAGAISFHELVPGHHFQINLQREHGGLPPFRRTALHAGYTEGWGEYASSVVAAELGMYRDGYEIYGRLAFDAFFIARLVVDTGMNRYAWPRARAVAYMKQHTLESDVQIDSETLRYSTRSPAQALAYRMGREVMVALRSRAEAALGGRFDLRHFHEAILGSGSLPLFLLERHIDWWIARTAAGDAGPGKGTEP